MAELILKRYTKTQRKTGDNESEVTSNGGEKRPKMEKRGTVDID